MSAFVDQPEHDQAEETSCALRRESVSRSPIFIPLSADFRPKRIILACVKTRVVNAGLRHSFTLPGMWKQAFVPPSYFGPFPSHGLILWLTPGRPAIALNPS
jgi:hypothetical protein